jgi:HAE1 family hydrophobic/amphiphilic exporter-1
MNLSRLFISRPVMTVLVMLGILLFGIMAYRQLPVSDLPNVDFPTLQVTATLPGASPGTMAASVATPLEKEFTTIAGLDSMTSSSSIGTTAITLQFTLSRELDKAATDVQAAIAKVAPQLPRDMPAPPSYKKVNPADQPILYIALTSSTLPLSALNEYAETRLAQRLSTVSGVAQVNVFGSQKYAVRVQLDPDAMASRGIDLGSVQAAVAAANVNVPTGTLQGADQAQTVQATGQLTEAQEFAPVIVAWRNGAAVRLSDLGTVVDSVENDRTAAWYVTGDSVERAIILAIQRQPGTNTVDICRNIRSLLPAFQKQLPAAVSLNVMFDRSESIEASVGDVKFTLVLTLCLVILVIFLFLRNVSATIIPSLALPMSVVATFAAMYLLGFSLDNLSLMGLTLSVGFVIDDAIVMLENIVRHMEMGKSPMQAAIEGSKEVSFTILSMTLSLTAVFIPIVFMGGLYGRLFNEFAVTVSVAILVSGFVSLTLIPMLASRFLKHGASHGAPHGRLFQISERVFDAARDVYSGLLSWSLRHRIVMMLMSACVVAGTVWLFRVVPRGFIPDQDTGQVLAQTEAAQGISFQALVEHQRLLADIARADPDVSRAMSSCGARGNTGANQGILFMRLKPRAERADKASVDDVIARLRVQFAQVPGMRAFLSNPPLIRIGGQLTRSPYQYTLRGTDTDELYEFAPKLQEKMRDLPGFIEVSTDLQVKNPQLTVDIDRDAASSLGVTASQIEQVLYSAYGSRQVSTIYAPNNQYQVIMELQPQFRLDPAALGKLRVQTSRGDLVPLEAVARFVPGVGPLTVNHLGQLPAVTISFNLKPGTSLGPSVQAVDALARSMLPTSISTSFQGQAQAFQAATQGMAMLLVMAILVIYLVLGILYESFIHPLTILSALPFAGFGALLTLLLFKVDLSIYAFMGVIMLVGLVKKNGIMMVDFAIELRREGRSPVDAIHEACLVRFRPIMMTTMAALVGTLPIALGFGAGAESRRPLGLAVVGGLLFSQVLTLFVTPVVYVYMEAFSERLRRWFPSRTAKADAPAPRAAATHG